VRKSIKDKYFHFQIKQLNLSSAFESNQFSIILVLIKMQRKLYNVWPEAMQKPQACGRKTKYIGRKVWFRQQGQLWQVLKRSLKSICCKNSGKTSEKEAKLKCR